MTGVNKIVNNLDFVVTEKIKAEPGRRFINYILDLMLRCFVFFVLIIIIGVIGRLEYEWTTSNFILEWLQQLNFWRGYSVWLLGSFLYYFTTEIFISRSIAKLITGTIVVSNDGSKPKSMAILKRTLFRFIPIVDFVSFLYP